MSFFDTLNSAILQKDSLLCIGLDPVFEKIPSRFQSSKTPMLDFCRYIIDETHEYAVAFKPNSAFFEAEGANGIAQLKSICEYIHATYPNTLIFLDAKRADIGSTNEAYSKFAFHYLQADAITLHPYLGQEGIQPFLDQKEKGCIILCHTSNPGAGEIQELLVEGTPLFERVAHNISTHWNTNQNCMLVVGATYPEQLKRVRGLVGDLPILVPGIGAQGGNLEATLKVGLTDDKKGLIITVSRSVIFADDPKEEARKIHSEINNFRK